MTRWARSTGMFYGFIQREDGFMELVKSHSRALTFSRRSDGFLSLDTDAKGKEGFQLSKRSDGFIEPVDISGE